MSIAEKRPDLKRKVIKKGSFEDIRVIAYEENWNFQPMAFNKELTYCNAGYYICVFKGEEEIERLDFGKRIDAIDYVGAYVEQKGTPCIKYFEIDHSSNRNIFDTPNVMITFSYTEGGTTKRIYKESFREDELSLFIEESKVLLEKSSNLELLLDINTLGKLADKIKNTKKEA